MSAVRRGFLRLLSLLRQDRAEREYARELAVHLELLEDEYRRNGLSSDEARRQARLRLGGLEVTRELHRDAQSYRWLDNLVRDVRYAFRMLWRTPVTTNAAVLSLALGIGLNAAVFAVVDWVIVRPLPYPQPHQLVRVRTSTAVQGLPTTAALLTPDEFARFSHATSFRSSAAFSTALRIVGATGMDSVHAVVARVDGDLFATLGLQPALGRSFSDQERRGVPVAVLAYGLWQRKFHSDSGIVGGTLTIDGQLHTIVGIMPSHPQYPADADIWRPLTPSERQDPDRDLVMIARLADGASSANADAELSTLLSGQTRRVWTEDLQRSESSAMSAALSAVAAAGVLILLIVCANVAALLGARGSDRAAELSVRNALGATRARLITQVITEALTVVALGVVAGLALGKWTLALLLAFAPAGIPRLSEIVLDWRILAAGLGLTPAIALLVGLVPALRLSRASTGVSTHGRRATRRSGTRRALVLAQVTMAVVLTAAAGLLGRGLAHLVAIDNGFAVEPLAAMDLSMRGGGDLRPLFRDLTSSVESIEGVRSAAFAMQLPTDVVGLRTQVRLNDGTPSSVTATLRPVGARYFDVLGVPIIEGRTFQATDVQTAPRVGIVNARFVHDILGATPLLGTRLTASLLKEPIAIVGVAGDLTPAGEIDRPALYVPIDQVSVGGRMFLLVNARDKLSTVAPVLSARVRSIAPNLASDRVLRVADLLEAQRSTTRFSTQLVASFAGLALLLSAIGVYGLAAGEVSARWRELAIRLTLGASLRRSLWTVMRPAAAVIGGGAVCGTVISAIMAPKFASLFHGVSASDIPTLTGAPVVLLVTGIVATLVAATRVFRVDPAETLRME